MCAVSIGHKIRRVTILASPCFLTYYIIRFVYRREFLFCFFSFAFFQFYFLGWNFFVEVSKQKYVYLIFHNMLAIFLSCCVHSFVYISQSRFMFEKSLVIVIWRKTVERHWRESAIKITWARIWPVASVESTPFCGLKVKILLSPLIYLQFYRR